METGYILSNWRGSFMHVHQETTETGRGSVKSLHLNNPLKQTLVLMFILLLGN